MQLINKIITALLIEDYKDYHYDYHFGIHKYQDKYEISYGRMYNSPELNFDKLVRLSQLFGTTKIDVDDYSNQGCETCDYGSSYGHTIQIYEVTLNKDELDKLVDIQLDNDDIGLILLGENYEVKNKKANK